MRLTSLERPAVFADDGSHAHQQHTQQKHTRTHMCLIKLILKRIHLYLIKNTRKNMCI